MMVSLYFTVSKLIIWICGYMWITDQKALISSKMHKGLHTQRQWHSNKTNSPYGIGAVFPWLTAHTHTHTHLALVYFSFSNLIWFNSGLHRFNLQMKNVVWHFIWLPRMCSGWPSFLMKLFKGPAAQHYWHSLNTWDRLGVCNKLCCAVPLRTKLMCRDFTFQHHSGLGFSIKHSTVLMMLPKQVFTPLFPPLWLIYLP